MTCRSWIAAAALAVATVAGAAPTRTSPIAVAGGDLVFVVNPDSNTMARLDFSGIEGVLTHEAPVGAHPRTVAVAGTWVFSADQRGDTVTRCDQADLGNCTSAAMGTGCNPFGVAPTPAGDAIVVSCQGSSELVLLSTGLEVTARVKLPWPNARAIAVASDGTKAYVTHFLTEEPGTDGHVSVVDLVNKSVATVFAVEADFSTCETQNSGQGVLNQLWTIALVPDGAPAEVAGQLWVGGTLQNNVTKGIFKREPQAFYDEVKRRKKTIRVPKPGTALFPHATFVPFPQDGINRNKYQASFHDIIRFGIVKLDATTGARIGKIDIDEAAIATDLDFSPDGTTAFTVDQTFNSYHLFNTRKGQGNDVTTLFAGPGSRGPGGADPAAPCLPEALRNVTSEAPYRIAPQAQITTIDGYNPVDLSYTVVDTGVDFDSVEYFNTGVSRMRAVPDGIGTIPIGVRLSPDGERAYIFNYASRNVVALATGQPLAPGGKPANLRCTGDVNVSCDRDNDCPVTTGFCNHPGGAACGSDAECGTNGPCVFSSNCVPLVLRQPVSTITGRCVGGANDGASCKVGADCASGVCSGILGDPTPPAILDGKILFITAARDASVPNEVGLGQAAPLFNEPHVLCASGPNAGQKCLRQSDCGDPEARLCSDGQSVPGEVVSVAHDASYVTCSTCHADFGGQDGRTWDFAQLGASLRNTMDLRGRPAFDPGTCDGGPNDGDPCTFDAACGDGFVCKANPASIPPNIPQADRDRWFNPMLTVHWNGDRDEVEDFEATFRSLQGAGDCDGVEHISRVCFGGLVQRDPTTTSEVPRTNSVGQNDIEPDLGSSNRNLPGVNGSNVGIRLTHLADFVYSLTDFVKNPNLPNEATERGRAIFNDPVTQCGDCHNGGSAGAQFFTDKAPSTAFDPNAPARADGNNPFVRHNVGTGNVFDQANPYDIALAQGLFQNSALPIPASRGFLGDYVTPILVDVWNTAPYLHDGSAHTLLDVVRPCDSTLDDCNRFGAGRAIHNAGTGRHGKTDILTPSQLNDLVAFQNALTTSTVLGTRARVVRAGTMTVSAVKMKVGGERGGRPVAPSIKVSGTFGNADVAADPAGGVVVQLGAPSGGTMKILERTFTMDARGKKLVGKLEEGEDKMSLTLRRRGDGTYRFTLAAKGPAVSTVNTGNYDLTIAFVVGEAQFVRNRTLVYRKGAYALPRKRG